MGPLNTTAHAFNGTLLKPVHRFLNMRQGAGIGLARIGAFLERPQTIRDNGKQDFLGDAIHPGFIDGAILKQDDANPVNIIIFCTILFIEYN